jgi:hypothetical protein
MHHHHISMLEHVVSLPFVRQVFYLKPSAVFFRTPPHNKINVNLSNPPKIVIPYMTFI